MKVAYRTYISGYADGLPQIKPGWGVLDEEKFCPFANRLVAQEALVSLKNKEPWTNSFFWADLLTTPAQEVRR